jgi:energy-coupling factor transport system ATP-binding protein
MDIQVEAVSYTYPGGVAALRGVSLHIAAGEKVAIIGQNGAGKTTLVRHLNGLLLPGAGRVTVGGWDTRQHPVSRLAARVGYVFQNPDDQLFKTSVWAEATFGPQNLGWPRERVEERARLALEEVGLWDARDTHPHDLSLGQRKNVALAAVLAMDTPIVVLDEPTTGQDYAGQALLGRVAASLHAAGKTVIAITHDIDFCAENFARVVVMGEGRVLVDGPARQALAQQELLASTGVEPPQVLRLADRLGLADTPLDVGEFIEALGRQRHG